jgi:hypothetical protein
VLGLGEDGEANSTLLFVTGAPPGRVGLADKAGRRRSSLYLGDHGEAGCFERTGEVALFEEERLLIEGVEVCALPELFGPFEGGDGELVEDARPLTHTTPPTPARRRVVRTKSSSASPAAPLAIDSSARRTPSSIVAARPET